MQLVVELRFQYQSNPQYKIIPLSTGKRNIFPLANTRDRVQICPQNCHEIRDLLSPPPLLCAFNLLQHRVLEAVFLSDI
jgi:hypothetical protein